MSEMSKIDQQLVDLYRRSAFDFLGDEIFRLLDGIKTLNDFYAVQRKGQEIVAKVRGQEVDGNATGLEITNATIGLGLLFSLAEEEIGIAEAYLAKIRSLKVSTGE